MKKQQFSLRSGMHALVWQEDDLFVAQAIEVEVASQGKSEQEALKNLEEAIELYFEDEKVNSTQITKTNFSLKGSMKTIFACGFTIAVLRTYS